MDLVRASVVLTFALAGCHAVEVLDPPPVDAAHATLFMYVDGDRAVAVRGIAAGAPWPVISAQSGWTLYALTYSCGLERLGLPDGAVALEEAPAATDRLPAAAAMYSIPVADGAAWSPVAALPPVVADGLRRLPLTGDPRCLATGAHYEANILNLPNDGRGPPAFAVEIDDTRVLIGTRDGHLYDVDGAGIITRRDDLEGPLYRGAVRDDDGQIWLVGPRGAVSRGTPSTGFREVTAGPAFAEQDIMALAISRGDAPFEIFMEGAHHEREHTFARYDGTRWTSLSTATPRRIYLPGVSWVGPREAISIGTGPDFSTVTRYKDGELSFEPVAGATGLSATLQHPTLGTLVALDNGGIDRRDGRRWVPIEGALPIRYVRILHPEGGGFLYAGSTSFNFDPSSFSQYQPSSGYCESSTMYTDFAASHVARIGDRALVILTLANFELPMGVTLLTRTAPAISCSEP